MMNGILFAKKIVGVVGGALNVSAGVASIILIAASTALIPAAGILVGLISAAAGVLV